MLLAIVSLNVRSTNPIESRFKKFAAYIVIKTNFDSETISLLVITCTLTVFFIGAR